MYRHSEQHPYSSSSAHNADNWQLLLLGQQQLTVFLHDQQQARQLAGVIGDWLCNMVSKIGQPACVADVG